MTRLPECQEHESASWHFFCGFFVNLIKKSLTTRFGLTQQQLANQVRVTVRTINSIERGEYNPSLVLAYKIARLFNTTVEELCCLKENVTLEEGQHEDQR